MLNKLLNKNLKHCFFIVTFAFSFSSFSQKDKVKNISNFKLIQLDSLISTSLTNNKITDFVKYSEEYIDIAIENKEYDEAIKKGVKVIYYVNVRLGKREKALKIINKLEGIKSTTTNSYLLGSIFLKKGGVYFNGKNYNEAIKNYSKAINNYSSKDSIHVADALYFRGQAYFNISDFYNALTSFKEALKYYTNLKDQAYIYYTKSSIIDVNAINNLITKTIEERLNLIKEKINANYLEGLSSDYLKLANEYKNNKQYSKQEKALYKALKAAKKENDEFLNLTYIYSDLTRFYLQYDNLAQANLFYNLASKSIISNENDNYYHFQKLKAHYLFKTNKLTAALKLSKENLINAKKQNYTQNIIDINELLYKIYKAQNNLPEAFKFYTKFHTVKDSLFNKEKLSILLYYQTLYDIKQKEDKIRKQKTDIHNLTEDKKDKDFLLLISIILSILIIALLFFFFNSIYLKKSQQLDKNYSSNLLSYIDNERKRVSKDIHDSLGHKLLLIKNEAVINNDDKTCELVNKAINEIRVISKNLQPIQISQIGITKTIQAFIDEIDTSYQDILIFGDIDNIDNILLPEQELNLFRIIQESLNNIIKHSKADSAKISIHTTQKHINLIIKDNGIGFNYNEKYKNAKGLGLKNLKNRLKSLNGISKITSKINNGTVITILIPK
ncbi:ATP-binding protein [uncultured Tenacibaculum sp.]|uniref:ATP-binding protein n=1 Tax=uncultured Tenacibaculum sp. TaxID=174713 RepID=UPI0026396B43|nr:ATP-binding protein [uncultured Tenacibaculum sp.]